MRHISTLLIAAITAMTVASCSENTVGGGMIQKRKYTKGFYLNRHSSGKTADERVDGKISVNEDARTAEAIRHAVAEEPVEAATNPAAERSAILTDRAAAPEASEAPAAEMRTVREKKPLSSGVATAEQRSVHREQIRGNAPMKQQKVVREAHRAAAAESALLILLLVILAFFLPWLSVLLYEGATTRFWIILLLWLLAIIGFFWPIAWALGVIAIVYAILIVLGVV